MSFVAHPISLSRIAPLVSAVLLFSTAALAKAQTASSNDFFSDPIFLVFFFIGVALLPIVAIMTTSFAKIIVVLSIARQAIGTAQAPPNIVIMSIAIILTCFSMYPVFSEIYRSIDMTAISSQKGAEALETIVASAKEPLRTYLTKHAKDGDKELFHSLLIKNPANDQVNDSDFIVLAPAFLISELSMAFQIGFLVYLPFLVIDMTVANLLMALGMQMLAPTTISLPFKILLFVLVDGWRLLSEGLVKV